MKQSFEKQVGRFWLIVVLKKMLNRVNDFNRLGFPMKSLRKSSNMDELGIKKKSEKKDDIGSNSIVRVFYF